MHGLADRVTNPAGSKLLIERASSTHKEIQLYEGVSWGFVTVDLRALTIGSQYEHVMLRTGRDEEDDQKRQRILSDMVQWLKSHAH